MNRILKTEKLSFGTIAGYSAGQIGDALAYNLFFTFFFFFLTEVAQVQALYAGIINLIVILWDAISDPIIGYISDNWKSKYGRRRPFILAGAFPLALLIVLCFTAVDFSPAGKFVYYTVLAILFWTAYTMVDIPYYSLGAELTQDFDERTRLRIWGSMAIYIAVAIVGFAPLFVSLLGGGSPQAGWSRVALAIGVGALLFDLLCWNSTRGKEIFIAEREKVQKVNVLRTYIQAVKIKPMKFVVGANFFFLLGQGISLGITLHVINYLAQLTEGQITLCYTLMPVFSIMMLPIVNSTAIKFGKRTAFVVLIGLSVMALVLFYLINIFTFFSLIIHCVIWGLASSAFWTLCYSMAYDNTELDEFIHGSRREGVFVSFMSFSQKVGSAVGVLVLGIILNLVGYNAVLDTQPQGAVEGLKSLFTWGPALFLFLSSGLIVFYPLTKARFSALEAALEAKKEGKKVDTSGFHELLEEKRG